jgi:CheY-like chemotaxis protein
VKKVRALILALHEDDENSHQVAESLKQCGHKVIQCKKFTYAISVLQAQQVALIISDVHLENGGNVFDFLRWAKRNPSTKDTPFVLFS